MELDIKLFSSMNIYVKKNARHAYHFHLERNLLKSMSEYLPIIFFLWIDFGRVNLFNFEKSCCFYLIRKFQ